MQTNAESLQFAAHHNIEASTHLPKIAFDAVKILFKIDHVLYPSFLQRPLFTNDKPNEVTETRTRLPCLCIVTKKRMRCFRYFVHDCFL